MNGTLTVSQQPDPAVEPPRSRWRRLQAWATPKRRRRIVRALLSLAAAVLLLTVALPQLLGTTLQAVLDALKIVTSRELIVLAVVWALGLFVHSFVLTGALPGLSRRRALTLNLTGSAVSNVVPFGGAVGMSLNYYMLRLWRVSAHEFASYTLVTNLWIVLMKLAMPALALGVALATGMVVGHVLALTAGVAAVILATFVTLVVLGLASPKVARLIAVTTAHAAILIGRALRRPVQQGVVVGRALETRDLVAQVVRRRWLRLSVAMTGYGALQALLLWGCLRAVDAQAPLAAVFAAYAVERVFTLVCVTPAGLGLSEAGATAMLAAMGVDPAIAAAGVLLYRAFVSALEVPIGGTWLGGWFLTHWRRGTLHQGEASAPAPAEAA